MSLDRFQGHTHSTVGTPARNHGPATYTQCFPTQSHTWLELDYAQAAPRTPETSTQHFAIHWRTQAPKLHRAQSPSAPCYPQSQSTAVPSSKGLIRQQSTKIPLDEGTQKAADRHLVLRKGFTLERDGCISTSPSKLNETSTFVLMILYIM